MSRRETLFLISCLLVAILSSCVDGANILFFIGFGGASHRLAMAPLATALSEKGHNVTFLAQEKPKDDSNINYYVPSLLTKHWEDQRKTNSFNFYDMRASSQHRLELLIIPMFGLDTCEKLLSDPDFKEWMRTIPPFDLVIIDGLLNECGYVISHAHKAKTIVFSISSILPWAVEGFGVPDETSSITDLMLAFPKEMNFFQRMASGLMPVIWKFARWWQYFPSLETIVKENTDFKDFPSFTELERNTSLFFVNTYAAQEYPRSLPPNVIPVGGISWVEKRKPLPKDMEAFINKGKEGFIYVSFGSFIDFLTFGKDAQETFTRALKRFPNIQFIWKLNKVPNGLPDNFFVDKWLPQQDLLLHPKIRAFITHSGIGGVNEAIYSSVPLICFPIFSEQDYNANLVQSNGYGIKMEITKLKEQELVDAINKILQDQTYRDNAKKMNKLFTDRPMKPVETALWWTEYVLRHDNTDSFRPLHKDQWWFVKRQLDVWFVVATVTVAVIALMSIIFCKLVKMCCCKRGDQSKGRKASSPRKLKQK